MYKWFLDLFGWQTWSGQFSEEMRIMANTFQNTFNTVGSWTAITILFVITITMIVMYYYMWNKLPGFHFRISHWLVFLFINAVLVGAITYVLVGITTHPIGAFEKKAPFYQLALINLIYSIVLYFVCSIIVNAFMKNTTNASCTPFKL